MTPILDAVAVDGYRSSVELEPTDLHARGPLKSREGGGAAEYEASDDDDCVLHGPSAAGATNHGAAFRRRFRPNGRRT